MDKKLRYALTHMIISNMYCPHCGARNNAITLHPVCSPFVGGDFSLGLNAECAGCKESFNCLTGNVDDGVWMEDSRENKLASAVARVETIRRAEKEQRLKRVKELLNKYFVFVERGRIRYKGTIWKLDTQDELAIIFGKWNTPKTLNIRVSINKILLLDVLLHEFYRDNYVG